MTTQELKFDEKGLIPAVVQDFYTKKVLTVAYMNAESLDITLREKRTCFWSRSRQELWRKGETSGNVQHVVSVTADCDGDALVVEAFGLGGIPEYDGITETLLAWVDAGKTLVMTTQCPYEGADLSVYEVGRAFCDRPGVLMGGSATTEALLAKTMWALAQAAGPDGVVDREKLAELFASC